MIEFELKVKVSALGPIRDRLVALKATVDGVRHEHDIYYNSPVRDFGMTDEALRVRYAEDGAMVTYKGAKLAGQKLKAREELNLRVTSGETCESIFGRLGFTKTAEVDKRRELYTYKEASIALDEVQRLGTFIEIEIMAEKEGGDAVARIDAIQKELGVVGDPIIFSYLELLMAQQ